MKSYEKRYSSKRGPLVLSGFRVISGELWSTVTESDRFGSHVSYELDCRGKRIRVTEVFQDSSDLFARILEVIREEKGFFEENLRNWKSRGTWPVADERRARKSFKSAMRRMAAYYTARWVLSDLFSPMPSHEALYWRKLENTERK